MPRKTPQMQRPFQLEARPKRADSLVCNILPDTSDKFSKFSLTHTFPEDNHCSRYARTLERHAPHRTNFPPDYATVSQGWVPNSSSPTTTTVSREDLVRLLSVQIAMTVDKHLF